MIVGGFPTVALDRGASGFATALHIRERYAKFPIHLFLFLWELWWKMERWLTQWRGIRENGQEPLV